MCDPITIAAATFALGTTQAVAQHIGTNNIYEANRQASNYNFARETEAINRQDSQLQQERSQQAMDTAIATLKAQGDISASAGDMGLSGTSIARQINASMFGIGRQATTEEINFRNQRVELASSRTDAEIRRQSQINSKPRSSVGMLALGIGEAGLSATNAYKTAKKG